MTIDDLPKTWPCRDDEVFSALDILCRADSYGADAETGMMRVEFDRRKKFTRIKPETIDRLVRLGWLTMNGGYAFVRVTSRGRYWREQFRERYEIEW